MKTIKPFLIASSFGLFSCNNATEQHAISKHDSAPTVSADSTIKPVKATAYVIPDSIPRFDVDDFSVTYKMFVLKTAKNDAHEMQSGNLYSYDKAWFSNDTLNQALVFELYTDGHRAVTYHFYKNAIPNDLIKRIDFNLEGGELASEKQKLANFKGFLKQCTPIQQKYFTSNKGFQLGDSKQKAIAQYGTPDSASTQNQIEMLTWNFMGEMEFNASTQWNGKPFAKESFGHQVTMYFKKGRLIGHIIYNAIP